MESIDKARQIALTLLEGEHLPPEPRIREVALLAQETVKRQPGYASFDLEDLVSGLRANVNTSIGQPIELLGDAPDHQPWLPDARSEIEWRFSLRYRRYLREMKHYADPTLNALDRHTERILEKLENPRREGAWDRRGMVVGQVQSGKTSNYIDLACKAVDAGYKLIVILTGTTNSLRAQTQLRVDEGIIGWDTRLNLELDANAKFVGVGLLSRIDPWNYRVIPPTNANERGDFNLAAANRASYRLGGDPIILVMKKHGGVLKYLRNWALKLHAQEGQDVIQGIPVLVIDDEADVASVNTRAGSGGDEDPTTINRRIRELLSSFAQSAYVAYTATPFANIFIYPEEVSPRFSEDLFPRDFLISLPVPSDHVGPTRVFGLMHDPAGNIEATEGLPLLRGDAESDPSPNNSTVADTEGLIPSVHRSSLEVNKLPSSLIRAMKDFLLVCAARAARGKRGGPHNSMLVHVTRFQRVQGVVAELVDSELRNLQNRIRYGDGNSPNRILDELRMIWEKDFHPTSKRVSEIDPELMIEARMLTWPQVEAHLDRESQRVQVKTINGTSQDALNYWDHPDGVNVVVIGGDKLSRGLTLEGLSISYFLRASKLYDTLLQMGRWFGYRPGYADLCRLYTTPQLVDYYRFITLATEELQVDLERMKLADMSPRQFGLRVRNSPNGLEITARNKMRSGVRLKESYSGEIPQTIAFDTAESTISEIFNRVDRFLRTLNEPMPDKRSNLVWSGVPGSAVAELLQSLPYHDSGLRVRWDLISSYIMAQLESRGLSSWHVALISNSRGDTRPLEVGGHSVRATSRDKTESSSADSYRIGTLVSPLDERIGLTDSQIDEATRKTQLAYDLKESRAKKRPTGPVGRFLRGVRDSSQGLLLVYPLDPSNDAGIPYLGIAAAFPDASVDSPVDYTLNQIALRQRQEELDAEQES